ncbi:MAG: hypothetical protein ACRCV5_07720, partial [Afipia sp.]
NVSRLVTDVHFAALREGVRRRKQQAGCDRRQSERTDDVHVENPALFRAPHASNLSRARLASDTRFKAGHHAS